MDEPRHDSQPGAGPPQGPDGLPELAARRFEQALWWWRGAGLGLLALGGIKTVFDMGPGSAAALTVLLIWPAISVMLGGVCVTQARCAGEFHRRRLIPVWLAGLWIAVVAAVPLLLFTGLLAGVMITADRGAIGPVIWLALVFLAIGAGLFIVSAVDASVAARTGEPLLRLRQLPLVMGVLVFVLWSLEFASVIGFDRAHTYSFIVVLLAPWLLHLREPAEIPEPGVTPRSAAA